MNNFPPHFFIRQQNLKLYRMLARLRFVSKRDRRGYFRFVPIQLAEGRPLAEQLGIDPDRPGSFAFLANGQAYENPRPCCALRASFRAGSGHGSSNSSHG